MNETDSLPDPRTAIAVEHLECGYGGEPVLKDVSFTVARGEIFFIIGGSGCGKSTLLRNLVGLNTPLAGEVKFFGQPFTGIETWRLAAVLGEDLRQTDLIARYGGEEFAVLLPETTKSEAMQVAERMREAVEVQINDGATTWPQKVTVSVGVATFPEDGKTAEAVLSAADQAMYVAKRAGRNRVIGARSGGTVA